MEGINLIAQGAEAKIYEYNDMILKYRLKKEYRHPELDTELIKLRTRAEKKILQKLSESGLPVPKVKKIPEELLKDPFSNFNTICMQKIIGIPLKKANLTYNLIYELGILVRKIHDMNIVHGDLTTNNFILADKIYVIDFGLAFHSMKDEDKAVDLYVLEKAFGCYHGDFTGFYEGYKESSVIDKLKEVRKRGRKRELCSFG
ncbi:Bud32 kinase [Tubulinosema ratisbonensis]|uniref:non-specific serine/threonine protein kinase n=1 Tax=Tubulinosema ratisbonensis TaxID=291195 RepID=A0A437API5_9MICR|nr:Bud32 kinase [Tubulinosema ratisbonensis]